MESEMIEHFQKAIEAMVHVPIVGSGVKFTVAFTAAGAFNAFGWALLIIGEAITSGHGVTGASVLQIIQLGGTGGLIAALVIAVNTLWKDRNAVKTELLEEVARLQKLLVDERTSHRDDLQRIRETHRHDLDDITQKYTEELRSQIQALRRMTTEQFEEERGISDRKYKEESGD